MNRKILFRAKRIDNQEWVFGSLIQESLVHGSRFSILEYSSDEEVEDIKHHVHPATIGQYIGRDDVRGVFIFDGDNIEYDLAEGLGEAAKFGLKETVSWNPYGHSCTRYMINIKITGNIHA